MGRYATREEEVDGMLRAGIFVDVHSVLKQAVRASVEEYSLKKLEALYGFNRKTPPDIGRWPGFMSVRKGTMRRKRSFAQGSRSSRTVRCWS